jgi:gluconolactonase
MVLRTLLLSAVLIATQVPPPPEGAPTTPALRRLVADDGRVERVATNFRAVDSPVWVDGALVFTDPPRNQILSLREQAQPAIVSADSGGTAGLLVDAATRLVAAERARRRVVIREDGETTVLADRVSGQPLHGPTDLALTGDGAIYVLDQALARRPPSRQGRVIRLGEAGAAVVVADLPRPTGLAVTRDGGTLYVADAALSEVRAYEIDAAGKAGPARRLASIVPWKRGLRGRPGGITLDEAGRLYLAGPGGIWVLDGNGGRLGVIATPETPSACAFGGADGKTLYIAAETSLYKVRMTEGVLK